MKTSWQRKLRTTRKPRLPKKYQTASHVAISTNLLLLKILNMSEGCIEVRGKR
ncbi:unnamed protein product [Ixodes pacificus]